MVKLHYMLSFSLAFLVNIILYWLASRYSIAQFSLQCSGKLLLESNSYCNIITAPHILHHTLGSNEKLCLPYAISARRRWPSDGGFGPILVEKCHCWQMPSVWNVDIYDIYFRKKREYDGILSSQSPGEIILIQWQILKSDNCVRKKRKQNIGKGE